MKILVADDDPTIRKELSEILTADRHEVRAAADGREAKKALESATFDVALVDLVMPGASGLDVLHHAGAIGATCAVIVVTGHATVDAAVEAMKAGAVDFVVKPFEVDSLRRTLDGIAEERRARDRLSQLVGSVRSAAEVLDSARGRGALISVAGSGVIPLSGGRTLYLTDRPKPPDGFSPDQLHAINAILEEHIARMDRPVVYLAGLSAVEAKHGREDVLAWLRQVNHRCHARRGALVLGAGDAAFASEIQTSKPIPVDSAVQGLLESLANPIRRAIVAFAAASGPASYSALLHRNFADSSSKLSFHLTKLQADGLLTKRKDGTYGLTEQGLRASGLVRALSDEGESLPVYLAPP